MRASTSRATGTRFVFFAGKGGVGKTTCAAAHALRLARALRCRRRAARRRRVVLISTDPAHSLGDALGQRLSSRPVAVRGAPALDAVELHGPRAFARWMAQHGTALGDAIEHGTWLDRADVDALLGLPVPGVDELVGLLAILRLAERGYDTVVVDTAPTGHLLRLLGAPQAMTAASAVLDALQREHRMIRRRFASLHRPEAADRVIELIAAEGARTAGLLRDRQRTEFHWVMLPEALSLAETVDGLHALRRARIPVRSVVVNRAAPPGPACPICDPRRREERRVIARARRAFGARIPIEIVADALHEPKGPQALARLHRPGVRWTARRGAPAPARPAGEAAPSARLSTALAGTGLLLVGGKGGVGKTTVAAATALHLARAHRDRRVLLLSTDPAHSVGDVLDRHVDDRARAVRGGPANLYVRELDAASALRRRRAALEVALQEIAATVGAAGVSGRGVPELLDLAPPGIDELFGLLAVAAVREPEYEHVVVDTAPTGHTLRLLEMPEVAREWAQVLMRVLLKYRNLVRPGALGAELVELSQQIRALRDLLGDSERAQFLVVTRAARLPRLETERLLDRLRALGTTTDFVIVNGLTQSPGTCPRCVITRELEQRQLRLLGRRCRGRRRGCAIIQTPLAAPPPRGIAGLTRWAGTWIA